MDCQLPKVTRKQPISLVREQVQFDVLFLISGSPEGSNLLEVESSVNSAQIIPIRGPTPLRPVLSLIFFILSVVSCVNKQSQSKKNAEERSGLRGGRFGPTPKKIPPRFHFIFVPFRLNFTSLQVKILASKTVPSNSGWRASCVELLCLPVMPQRFSAAAPRNYRWFSLTVQPRDHWGIPCHRKPG